MKDKKSVKFFLPPPPKCQNFDNFLNASFIVKSLLKALVTWEYLQEKLILNNDEKN